ncbi:hypothetical protein [Desulfurobacterium sp. TC5-1]|uniref:hypothetical protein n=1 Tax=Desulfurobacterium sp. TC5-1 TaxID=1158318 RepID=UPI0003B3D2A3|nr:hypothetical protein [Desulfurobacterium sp. TC5-1]
MKARIIVTIEEDLLYKLTKCVPPNFRSLFIETLVEEFIANHPPEEIKEKIFKDFDKKAIKMRIKETLKKSDKISHEVKKGDIEEEIKDMW